MFFYYLKVALRVLLRHKRFTFTNILGLSIGLAAFALTSAIYHHETTYDNFFSNNERIYAVYTQYKPDSGAGVTSNDGTYLGVQPLLADFVPGLETSARSISKQHVIKATDYPFYQEVRFVDPAFLDIFQLEYVYGDPANALAGPDQAILTENTAVRYFGRVDVLGETITMDNRLPLTVSAVVRDLPLNSHFRSSPLPKNILNPQFEVILPMGAYRKITGDEPNEFWNDTDITDITYVLLKAGADETRAEAALEGLYDRHMTEKEKKVVERLGLRPLSELSQYIWNATGVPVPLIVRLVGFLILLIAVLNYTLMANAQSARRTREIGMRKSIGARSRQLLIQFTFEGVILTLIAFLISLAIVELSLQFINPLLGQDIHLLGQDPIEQALFLGGVVLATGMVANLYPAWKTITTPPVACFATKDFGNQKSFFRNAMIGTQFFIAVVLFGTALIIFAQNRHMQNSGSEFALDKVLVVDNFSDLETLNERTTMKSEAQKSAGVEAATLVSQPPYLQGQRWSKYTQVRDDNTGVRLLEIWGDEDMLTTFQIPLLAGRNFSGKIIDTAGAAPEQNISVNVILNEYAARSFGWSDPQDAIGKTLIFENPERSGLVHTIIGVTQDVNYLGFHNEVWPMIFIYNPRQASFLAVRSKTGQLESVKRDTQQAWRTLQPNVPLLLKPLRTYFDEFHGLFRSVGFVIALLTITALLLSLFGLYGLAAFSMETRTREVAIRKVYGAENGQIVRLFTLQSVRPVVWALLLGTPLAFMAASAYLDFFSDRIGAVGFYIAGAVLATLLLSVCTVAFRAQRAAQMHPIKSLRDL